MKQAQEASGSGTFGVGGTLMDLDGNVICEMHNQVINIRFEQIPSDVKE